MLTSLFNVLLMIAGFGVIIAIHELGHFLAAKWAGVRVHAFAIGFGPAIFSWRKGLGFRRGLSEREHARVLAAQRESLDPAAPSALSPTEYRLNWFPFGGYVKMLGQEDLSPITAATAPDSYSAKPVWKRMVIISAGVVMNLVLACVLFVAAYSRGLMEVAPVVGVVTPGSPAAVAGLEPGDRVISIGGKPVETFNDIIIGTVMAPPRAPLPIEVERPGAASPITLTPVPERGTSGLQQIGAGPEFASELLKPSDLLDDVSRDQYRTALEAAGFKAVEPGMRLVGVEGQALPGASAPGRPPTAHALRAAIEQSRGSSVRAVFASDDGRTVEVEFDPVPALPRAPVRFNAKPGTVEHVAGFVPVMTVRSCEPRAQAAGLKPGDVIARVGSAQWPSTLVGIAEVNGARGQEIDLVVLRDGALVPLRPKVGDDGRIGISLGILDAPALVTKLPGELLQREPTPAAADGGSAPGATGRPAPLPAQRLTPGVLPGSRVVSVDGLPVRTFADLATRLALATREAHSRGEGVAIELELTLPVSAAEPTPPASKLTLELTSADVAALQSQGWDPSPQLVCFDIARFKNQASGPVDAVGKGFHKTREQIILTYATFARLVQGSVPVDQLQGPVGITHLGSRVAEQGFVYLIFFLGLISVNLAVVNFLPLPITDGGHMVFLLIEAITRKPVSIAIQNIATIAGLIVIGTVFVLVTYNDIVRLITG